MSTFKMWSNAGCSSGRVNLCHNWTKPPNDVRFSSQLMVCEHLDLPPALYTVCDVGVRTLASFLVRSYHYKYFLQVTVISNFNGACKALHDRPP